MNVATASPGELVIFTTVFAIVFALSWRFTRFLEGMWVESFQSRTIDRRFLRWQRAAFRGRYPLGHWEKPGSIAYVKWAMRAGRGVLLLVACLWAFALLRRLLG